MVDQSHILKRKALASMLSEALCSRAKRVSEIRTSSSMSTKQIMGSGSSLLIFPQLSIIPEDLHNPTTLSLLSSQSSSPVPSFSSSPPTSPRSRSRSRSRSRNSPRTQTRHLPGTGLDPETKIETNEIPFAFRAKQAGRVFRGGKQDGVFNSIFFLLSFSWFIHFVCHSSSFPRSSLTIFQIHLFVLFYFISLRYLPPLSFGRLERCSVELHPAPPFRLHMLCFLNFLLIWPL